mmetsp:Transcript_6754/g.16249  ORF Transcript_6754/g.16249 Transcript_6754/m.16249 type:complete len:168 (+) Transcript_6754:618-1121(+)
MIKKCKLEGHHIFSGGAGGRAEGSSLRQAVQKINKASKAKGRTYTSKYRGVHQTFPTRRWEAQFRRNGKPTSLGCFDHELEAARAYDKMMIWCTLHQSTSVKGWITNFDPAEYAADVPTLQRIGQDELVMLLRRDGRMQAAQGAAAGRGSAEGGSDSGTQSEGGERR